MNTLVVLGITFVGIVIWLSIPYIKMKRRGHRLHQQYMARLRETV
jgi:hypothetical protein